MRLSLTLAIAALVVTTTAAVMSAKQVNEMNATLSTLVTWAGDNGVCNALEGVTRERFIDQVVNASADKNSVEEDAAIKSNAGKAWDLCKKWSRRN